jgi:hypothetical protein
MEASDPAAAATPADSGKPAAAVPVGVKHMRKPH